jgi:environmental stress-induced protein Ves
MITPLDPSQYRQTPWKNGGGVTIDIAEQDEIWRLSRTPIAEPGPFSDYSGFDRIQVLIAGKGLVLETADGEIDERIPFKPVRFAGETPVVSRLEAGPVEVVNLIGARDTVKIDLDILDAGERGAVEGGIHIAYCTDGPAILDTGETLHRLPVHHALRIDADRSTMLACKGGRVIVASIYGMGAPT